MALVAWVLAAIFRSLVWLVAIGLVGVLIATIGIVIVPLVLVIGMFVIGIRGVL